jgi:hypothetical protein
LNFGVIKKSWVVGDLVFGFMLDVIFGAGEGGKDRMCSRGYPGYMVVEGGFVFV